MRRIGFIIFLALLLPRTVPAQEIYVLDPQHARIGFSVSHMGLFTSEGNFRRFDSQLAIDAANPDRTRITVRIEAASASMATTEGEDMLRSAAYFDVTRHPDIRFRSVAISARSPTDYTIQGDLQMRGVTRPVTLSAKLVNRRKNGTNGLETVDFVVTGIVHRSEYGMVADQSFVADDISLSILARLELPSRSNVP